MKKLYFAIAFFVSFHVLDKSEGMNPEERRIRPMYAGSSSALVTNEGSRGVARMMTHNTRRPSPSRRGENVGTVNRREAEFNIILPGDEMAAIKIYDKHDQTVVNVRDKMYPVQELIHSYHHDFDKRVSYPVKQSFVSIDDEPLIVDRQVVIDEFEDFEHSIVHEQRRVENSLGKTILETYINTAKGIQVIKQDEIKTSKSQLNKTTPLSANKQTKAEEVSPAKKNSDPNNSLSREILKTKAMTARRPETSTAVKANTQTKVNEVSPAKKDSGSSNRTQVVKQDEIKTSKSQLDKTAPMAVNKQTKVTEASPVKKNLDSNNSLSRETPEAKAMIARRPETSTAVRANTSLKQKVETSSSSLSPKSQNNNYKTETSAKMVPSMNQSKIAVTSAGTLSEQKRYGTALNHKTTNSNIATSSKRSQGNNPKSSVKPLSASTQNTGNMLSKVNSTSGTNSRKDLAKKNSGKYKTSTKEFTTTPQKQETLQQAKPKPPMAYETAKKLPAPMPAPRPITYDDDSESSSSGGCLLL